MFYQKYLYYILAVLAFIIAVVFISIKDYDIEVDRAGMQEILKKQKIYSIQIAPDYTLFFGDKVYRMDTRNLGGLEIGNIPSMSVKMSWLYKILAILALLVIVILFMYKRKAEISKIETRVDSSPKDDMSLSILPMQSNVRLCDVAGIKSVKDSLIEIIDCLRNPYKYKDLGIYAPKGVLLIGPPGVGKTLIAKAIAGECNVPFFYQSGSSFVQLYVGIGAKRVRDLFNEARKNAPAIVFIDEIDTIGKRRGQGSNHEWESTLNELLTQMDGFSAQSGIVVIAATNREEVLDAALLRSGRFDRRIHVDLPDLAEREEILSVYLKGRRHNIDLGEAARLCVGFSGANIASLINEGAMNAMRHGRDSISMQDLIATSNDVLHGIRRQPTLSHKERYTMALYNASKALARYWLLEDFEKIALVGMEGEFRLSGFNSKTKLISLIKIFLSGNIGLGLHGLEESSIAKRDFLNAKYIATTMCNEYGMGERLISDNRDILAILEDARVAQREFLESNKDNISKLADLLMQKEEINKDDIRGVLEEGVS